MVVVGIASFLVYKPYAIVIEETDDDRAIMGVLGYDPDHQIALLWHKDGRNFFRVLDIADMLKYGIPQEG